MDNPTAVAQAMINVLAYFMPAFIVFLVVEWVTSLFRRDN